MAGVESRYFLRINGHPLRKTRVHYARIYGRYSVGELSGWIFLSHQVGAAVGSFVGGFAYDRFNDYTLAFHSAAELAFLAVCLVLLIPEKHSTRKPEIIPSAAGF